MRRPLVLTGPPAVGKTASGRRLTGSRPRGAMIDVDDLRQLVVSGHAAPWEGSEGRRQQELGVLNACALAERFAAYGIEVVLADVLTATTIALYRDRLPTAVIVHLQVSLPEARRRAAGRARHLTDGEFDMLHAADRAVALPADHHLDVTRMTLQDQVLAIERIWQHA